ncbi:microcin ABC transporter ATP-binding protein [Bordetella genomosp. 10]|uniref:Microcin ABC transporter ATP-binding protein n=1 Tax=Bordetella genomosp. 10 TaxID=1416804 RepID=A0A261SL19_9BORD|nr:ABC transporter ATP-binding protein [Bordetella genomosp. 10]OZI37855.1 microcin ABC transporter ATP-binding protein [Bordetella genomosp. 10]
MNPLLSIRNLSIALPPGADRPLALDGISLDLHPGEVLCMVGESGSGKSLAAGALLGLLPDGVKVKGGEAIWASRDLLRMAQSELRQLRGKQIGMVFQEPMSALNPLHTIERQLGEVFTTHTSLGRGEIRSRVLGLLESVQLPDPAAVLRAYPHELSGGQRQRVMIAMALALEPALLIADEPTTALDVTTQAQILALVHDLQRRKGTAVLFITHDFGVVAEIADRVAVLQRGVLVETGAARQVLEHPSHPYTRALIAAVPPLRPPPERPGLPESAPPALTVAALSKTYRRRGWPRRGGQATKALDNVSLQLPAGSTLGLVGESGSGKSTLARVVMGLVDADAGTLWMDGKPDAASRPGRGLDRAERLERARRIQMVFQDPYGSLNPRQRVGEIVAHGPILQGVSRDEAHARSRELFELVGLEPDAVRRYPHEFSGGQRQRVGLARALSVRPRILIADEPVSALDVSVQAQVLALLGRLREQLGLSILFITHDLRVAAQVCDRIAVMKNGRIVEEGPCRTLFEAPAHPYTQALLASVPGRDWRGAARYAA